MATGSKQHKKPQEALNVQAMVKKITVHLRTGQALASGLIGSVIGEVTGALAVRVSKGAFPFSALHLSELGFVIGVAMFLFIAPNAKLQDCLTVARSLFVDDRIT